MAKSARQQSPGLTAAVAWSASALGARGFEILPATAGARMFIMIELYVQIFAVTIFHMFLVACFARARWTPASTPRLQTPAQQPEFRTSSSQTEGAVASGVSSRDNGVAYAIAHGDPIHVNPKCYWARARQTPSKVTTLCLYCRAITEVMKFRICIVSKVCSDCEDKLCSHVRWERARVITHCFAVFVAVANGED